MEKITFPNGSYYVENKQDIINSLFCSGGTASGHYKRFADGITFYNMQDEPFLHLVANPYGERFFVSCIKEGKRIRFMHAVCSIEENRLGLDKLKYSERRKLAEDIYSRFN